MKRRPTIVALLLIGALALTGCRGKNGGAAGGEPVQQPAPATGAANAKPSIAPQVAASKVTVDLSDVDAMLAELERQLAEADKSPADSD